LKTQIIAAVAIAAASGIVTPRVARSQSSLGLSLDDAKTMARHSSTDLRAAREAVEAARGREIQAGAFSNPALSYSTERTSGSGQTNRQQIAGIEQRIEIGGQRGARRAAAVFRRRATEARATGVQASVDFEVARAYAQVVAADRRASLARQAAAAFTEAGRVSQRRLAAGDISVYADRRLKLEAARYAALEAEANLTRRSARITLSSLLAASPDSIRVLDAVLTDSIPTSIPRLGAEQLLAAALRNRADYQVASLESEAFAADTRLASRERIPSPSFSGGFKTEESAGVSGSLNGFAAGVSFPVPLFDRRKGAIQAASADARRAEIERESVRRRITREVLEAQDALSAVEQQRSLLAPQLGAPAAAALRSAQVAYAEGEITLLEWLDAVRAYHEAESAFANLVAESLIRRATLERAVSAQLATLVATQPNPGTNDNLAMENK
jgi:outer membrane protein, heavy metal efflux system